MVHYSRRRVCRQWRIAYRGRSRELLAASEVRYDSARHEWMMGSRTTKTTPQQNPAQESLAQAIWAILRQELVVVFVFWLSIGFPLLCQQHGLMSVFDLDAQPHSAVHNSTSEPLAVTCSVADHSASPLANMTLAGIVVVMPVAIATDYSVFQSSFRPPTFAWPMQLALPPLDEPPRGLQSI